MPHALLVVALGLAVLAPAMAGCHGRSDVARARAEQATAMAEEQAQEASLTSASLDAKDQQREAGEEAQRARGEMIAAFRLEQSDYRGRLQHTLDLLDGELLHLHRTAGAAARDERAGDLHARRVLLKADLVAVDRSTEQDWATLRMKVERDLEAGTPGRQLPPRTDLVPGEAP